MIHIDSCNSSTDISEIVMSIQMRRIVIRERLLRVGAGLKACEAPYLALSYFIVGFGMDSIN